MERFDTAVVGAGILGLAHAYHLARMGQRVVFATMQTSFRDNEAGLRKKLVEAEANPA